MSSTPGRRAATEQSIRRALNALPVSAVTAAVSVVLRNADPDSPWNPI